MSLNAGSRSPSVMEDYWLGTGLALLCVIRCLNNTGKAAFKIAERERKWVDFLMKWSHE